MLILLLPCTPLSSTLAEILTLEYEGISGMYAHLLYCNAAHNQAASQNTMLERTQCVCAHLPHFRTNFVNKKKKDENKVRALQAWGRLRV